MVFQVITEIPEGDEISGNLALPWIPYYQQVETESEANDYKGKYEKVNFGAAFLNLRQPVFRLGEIIIVDGDGRELVCDQRKASKWGVGWETFGSIEDAVYRSREVTKG